MQTLVVFDSKFGNTEHVAKAIARGAATHGSVSVMTVADASESLSARPDLLLLGGPTQRRNLSPGLRDFLDAIPASLQGVPTASFDTRYRGSSVLMGSAAREVSKRIGGAGHGLVAAPESFYIKRGGPLELQTLEPGELERAEAWGRAVGAAINGGSGS